MAALHGSRARSVVRFPGAVTPPAAVTPDLALAPVDPPAGLPARAVTIWRHLGPYALAKGTLVPETADAFAMLCRAVVLERKLGRSKDAAGGSNHRGMMQRVEAGMLRFGLSPNGKPILQAAKPEDPFAEFDQAAHS